MNGSSWPPGALPDGAPGGEVTFAFLSRRVMTRASAARPAEALALCGATVRAAG